MKRILCLALVLVMVFSLMPMSAFADDADADFEVSGEVFLGQTELQIDEDLTYYSFTPDKDSLYSITTEGDCDTVGVLDDSDWNCIASDDDSGEGNNFFLKGYLYAGNTYYIGVRSYSGSAATTLIIDEYVVSTSGSCGDNLTWNLEDNTLTITGIGEMYDFENNAPWRDSAETIEAVVIENGVTRIGNGAFRNCNSLTSVTIPDSVTSIGGFAFESCRSLESITIPDSVTRIGWQTFYDCSSLESAAIGGGIEEIGSYAFYSCTSLKYVSFAGDLPAKYLFAFPEISYEEYDEGFTFFAPAGNSTWTDSKDYNPETQTWTTYPIMFCEPHFHSFTETTVKPTEETLGYTEHKCSVCDFGYIDNYTSISGNPCGVCGDRAYWKLDDGVLTIFGEGNTYNFYFYEDAYAPWNEYRDEITTVVISNGITEIGYGAIYDCPNLTSITTGDTLMRIGPSVCSACSKLTSVTISDSVTSIGGFAFNGTPWLESLGEFAVVNGILFRYQGTDSNVTIPDSVTSIGEWAFSDAASVTVPDSVTTIESYAFGDYSSSSATDIYYNGTEAQWKLINIGEYGIPENATVHFKEHTHTYTAVVTEPTCLAEGYTTYTCACGDSYDDDFTAKVAHKTEVKNAKAASCTEEGYTGDTVCTVCEIIVEKGEVIAKLSHSFGAWADTKAATCTEKGEQQRTCSICGAIEAKETNALSHFRVNGICLNCGDVDYEQHEHIYTEGESTKATCTTDGYMVYNCACGDSYTAIMDHASGHYFSGPTCDYCGAVNPDFVEEPQPTISIKTDNGKPMLKWAAVDGAEKYEVYRATSKTGNYTKYYTTSSTSYTNTSAVPGTTYYYRVRAITANGNASEFSVIKSITCDCAQPVVTISTTASSGKPTLKWSAVDGATKYEIWRATSSTGNYTKYYTTTSTSYTNSSAVAGSTYYYKVKAICGKSSYGDSAFSAVKSITCDCAAPVVTISTTASSGKPTLKWSAVDGATKYEIWRATSKDGTYTKMYTTSNTSYTNSSAVAGKTYYYKVKALCGKSSYGDSAFSAIKSITCDCARPVVNITTSNGHPKLSWKAVDGATKYEVYRATSSSGSYTKLGTTSNLSYTNTGAKAGTTYYYKVIAVCGASSYGNSAYSTVVSIKAK